VHPHPEPLGDQLHEIRRAQRGIAREPPARERDDFVGELVRTGWTRACRHEPGEPARVQPVTISIHDPTQRKCCVVIPSFDGRAVLPPGIHSTTWDEIVERYATTERRTELLDGLLEAITSLRSAGCTRIYLDGSFVTEKELPGDFGR